MSTLDEITNEKQRITEALARVDAQRQKLTGELEELEATERVLARYNKGAQTGKASAKTPPPPSRPPQRDQAGAHALRPQERLAASVARPASAIMFLPWQSARRSRKSLQLAGAFARTMLAPRLPGTSGPVASKSAVGSSMSRSQRGRSNAPRFLQISGSFSWALSLCRSALIDVPSDGAMWPFTRCPCLRSENRRGSMVAEAISAAAVGLQVQSAPSNCAA